MNETNYSVIIEALGEDEIGTDILVTTFDGKKEHQQCKRGMQVKSIGVFRI